MKVGVPICDSILFQQEVAYIIENMTERSLVIIDELGRGTSNVEGISLAFAIAEYLQSNKSFSLFVTHFSQLYVSFNHLRSLRSGLLLLVSTQM
jgi:DNA mismatch repair ATPase MutS